MVKQSTDCSFQSEGKTVIIRDVWASNIDEEFENIRQLLPNYPVIAMDTEFPGVVAQPVGDYNLNDAPYQRLRCNVNLLKLIQLGITLADDRGNFVDGCTCWQFNFKFSLQDDLYAQDSIELLQSSGIDFEKFQQQGIDVHKFAELLMMSGCVLNDDVKWLTFHSSYDFGYLIKALTGSDLPTEENGFIDVLHTYFPNVYDIKYMMTAIEGLYGGLSTLADLLEVPRIGPMHQAGSDSLLTSQTYFKLVNRYFRPPAVAIATSSSSMVSARNTPKPSSNPEEVVDKDNGTSKSASTVEKLNIFDNNKAIEKYNGELFGLGNSKTNANVISMMKRTVNASATGSNSNFHSVQSSGALNTSSNGGTA